MSDTVQPMEGYQLESRAIQALYVRFRSGEISADEAATKTTAILYDEPKVAKLLRVIIGLFMPLLFLRR